MLSKNVYITDSLNYCDTVSWWEGLREGEEIFLPAVLDLVGENGY